jgi:FtsZ-binding cell division protein ZapB
MPPKRKLEVELYNSIETPIQQAIDVVVLVETTLINYLQEPARKQPAQEHPAPLFHHHNHK